jgi:hypothetical protein
MGSEPLVCKMPGCGGTLDVSHTFPIQAGCHSCTPCCGCSACGRVHSVNGGLMFRRLGEAIYLRNERLELLMEPKEFKPDTGYTTTANLYVCLADGEEEPGMPKMTTIEMGMTLGFDGMRAEMFLFRGEDGILYALHRGDVNFVEELAVAA